VLGVGTLDDLALVQMVGIIAGALSSAVPGHAGTGRPEDARRRFQQQANGCTPAAKLARADDATGTNRARAGDGSDG